MPIYAYRCTACGHEQDVLQKISDAALTVCPACSQSTYVKQVTAAGFQLKGSGWYVTDFRNGSSTASTSSTKPKPSETSSPAQSAGSADAGSSSGSSASSSGADSAPASAV